VAKAGAAASWAAAQPNGGTGPHAPWPVAKVKVRPDPAAAAPWSGPSAGEKEGGAIPQGPSPEWSGHDGAAKVQWLDTLSGDQSRAYGPAFAGWAKADPLAAIQRISSMKPSSQRDHAIGGFIFSYRWEDLVTSIAWAHQIQDAEFRKFVLALTAEAYARKEPAAAAAWLRGSGLPAETEQRFLMAMGEIFRNSTDPVLRQEALQTLLSGLTKENALAIRGQLGIHDPTAPAFRDFYFTWGKIAGIEAVTGGVATGAPCMGPSLAGWASVDAVAASDWLRNLDLGDSAAGRPTKGPGLKEGNLRDALARELVGSLAATDPSGALALAASLAADGHGVLGLIKSIAHQVSQRQGADAASPWAAAPSDAAGTKSSQGPDGQAEMETARSAALRSVAQGVSQTDPGVAGNWAPAHAPGPLMDEAMEPLCPADREAVLLPFREMGTPAEAGRPLEVIGEPARRKVSRALKKWCSVLHFKGITMMLVALSLIVPVISVKAAPAPLAAAAAMDTVSAAPSFSGKAAEASSSKLSETAKMPGAAIAAAAAVFLAAHVVVFWLFQKAKLRKELLLLRSGRISPLSPFSPFSPTSPASISRDSRPASPQTFTAMLQEIPATRVPMLRIKALLGLVGRVPVEGLAEAARELREGSPDWDPEAKMLIHLLLTRWATEDPDGAFASLNRLQPEQGADASSLLAGLAAADPARAAGWLGNPGNPLVNFPALGHILAGTVGKEWVRQDLDAALAWAASLPATQRAGAYIGALGTLSGTDPATAATIAGQLDPGEARLNTLGEISRTWAKKSPGPAMTWAAYEVFERCTLPKWKALAAKTFPGLEVPTPDQQGAQSPAGAEHDRAVRNIFKTWVTTRPAAATRFPEDLSTESMTGELLKAVAGSGSTLAPAGAANGIPLPQTTSP